MIDAVIFDLDGTIIINNEAYDVAFTDVLKKYVDVSGVVNHIGGVGVRKNWERLKQEYSLPEELSVQRLENETQEVYLQNIGKIELADGFLKFIQDIKNNQIKTALATGNDKETTVKILDHFSISDYFNAISTIYEAGQPKPEPDIFLLAANILGVDPGKCIAIEDSEAGIESAKKANMIVISVHEYSFTELTVEKLEEFI